MFVDDDNFEDGEFENDIDFFLPSDLINDNLDDSNIPNLEDANYLDKELFSLLPGENDVNVEKESVNTQERQSINTEKIPVIDPFIPTAYKNDNVELKQKVITNLLIGKHS